MKPALIRVDALNTVTGARQSMRAMDSGSAADYGINGYSWEPAISERPTLSMELMSITLDGKIKVGTASFKLDLKQFIQQSTANLYWVGGAVTIRNTGIMEGPSAIQDFQGYVTSASLDDNTKILSIDASVSIASVAVNLLTRTFGGSGGIDGDAALRGTLQPAGFGRVLNIQPVWFDTTNNIGMIDGYGNCAGIDWLAEGLSSYGPRQGDYPTYDALKAAIVNKTVAPGQWATCVAQGLVGLGAPASGVITCHATFNYNRTGALMQHILNASYHANIPLSFLDTAAFAALDNSVNRAVHYWTAAQRTVQDLCEAMAGATNSTFLALCSGLFSVSRAVATAPVGTLDKRGGGSPSVIDWQYADSTPPFAEVQAIATRPASVLTRDQVNFGVDLNDRGGYNPSTVYSYGDIVDLPDGSSYLYINQTPSEGIPVTNTSYWSQDSPPTKVDFTTQVTGQAKTDLINQAAAAAAQAAAAIASLNLIASDGWLSKNEKPQVVQDWNAISNEGGSLDAQANGFGIDHTVLDNARNALASYLGSLSPPWYDYGQDTPISSVTFNQKFDDYYNAKQLLINAMAQAAANVSNQPNSVVGSHFALGLKSFIPNVGYSITNVKTANGQGPYSMAGGINLSADWSGIRQVPWAHLVSATLAVGDYVDCFITPQPWNTAASIGQTIPGAAPYMLPVKRGDRVWVRCLGAQHRCQLDFYAMIYDAANQFLGGVQYNGARDLGGAKGDPANFNVMGGFFNVSDWVAASNNPAYVGLMWRMHGTGGNDPYIFWTEPAMGKAVLGMTVLPPYSDGPPDPTSDNTLAAYNSLTGQNPQDTTANLAAAQTLLATTSAMAQNVQAFTDDVADNNHASPDEKKRYQQKVQQWNNDVTAQTQKALSLGITTQATAYQNAWNTFYSFLINTVQINNTGSRTNFNRSQFFSLSNAFTNADKALVVAIQTWQQTVTQVASVNMFLDPRFQRVADQTAWLGFDSRGVVEDSGDGRRLRIPPNIGGDVNFFGYPVIMGPNDRCDVELEVYVASGITNNALFGVNFDGLDGSTNPLPAGAGVLTSTFAQTRDAWVTFKGSTYGSNWGTSLVSLTPHLVCQNITGGSLYFRNPRAYRVTGANALLGANGRGTTATLISTNGVIGVRASNTVGYSLTQYLSGNSVSVVVSQSTYRLDTGQTVTYPSGTFTGLAYQGTYYIWRVDPNLNGGTGYGISTSIQDAVGPGNVYLGYIVTIDSTGAGGGGGGLGTAGCVDPDMYVDIEGKGPTRARDVVAGDRILCLTRDMLETAYVDVEANVLQENFLSEIEAGGVTWRGSVNTPVPGPDGEYRVAGNAWAAPVPTNGETEIEWYDPTVRGLGPGPVSGISCHGQCYGAGREPGSYIFTHNVTQNRPTKF